MTPAEQPKENVNASVRAKFVCTFKQPPPREGEWPAVKVSFSAVGPKYENGQAVWDPKSDNQQFWDSSPSGTLDLYIKNAAAADRFEPGKEYYLDFIPAN